MIKLLPKWRNGSELECGSPMYRRIYWIGVTLLVVWTVFSAYSTWAGF